MSPDPPRQPEFLDATVQVPEHVMLRAFGEETVLLNLKTGKYHGLNPVGGRLLELAEEHGGSLRLAVAGVAEETGAPETTIAQDAAEFFTSLADRGLVVLHGPG